MNEERREILLGEWVLEEREPTFGEKLADRVADIGGSWTFIIVFIVVMLGWIVLNSLSFFAFDPPPFILLNLVLSTIAALQAPAIMMSQKRQSQRDRNYARVDFEQSRKSERVLMEMTMTVSKMSDDIQELREELRLLRRERERDRLVSRD